MPHRKKVTSVLYACLFACASCTVQIDYNPVTIKPPAGNFVYYGVNLDWQADSPAAYNKKLGKKASVYVRFFEYPLSSADLTDLDATITAVAAEYGMALLTLEPTGGLNQVTQQGAEDFAKRLAGYNARGVPVLVRFAHEMNGSWYPWGQKPTDYINAFRLLAAAIHKGAPGSAMLWTPNYGGGYPFSGGTYECRPGQSDFTLLDTNHDGALSMQDDPYLPYYPGDDAVDWVGMSLYHWGNVPPWGENEEPETGKFFAQLTGVYNGKSGDESALPDFYEVYYGTHKKPIAIAETAALYNTELASGPAELTIKQAWWRQVFNRSDLTAHPGIKMINWFEQSKKESEIQNALIDWRVFGTTAIAAAFKADLPDLLLFAERP